MNFVKIANTGIAKLKAALQPTAQKTLHQAAITMENGTSKNIQLLEATGNSIKCTINKTNSQESALSKLEARLKKLNTNSGIDTPYSNERFGKDGIKSILACAKTSEDIAVINKKLDELEQGKDIWTYNITSMFKKSNSISPTLNIGIDSIA